MGGAILVWGLSGCGVGSAELSTNTSHGGEEVSAGGTSGLAADLASAPWQVEYHGVRRLDFLTEQPAVAYREVVGADGKGRFGLRVTDVLTPHHDAPGFIAKQAQNEGFNYRYRGFRVLDPFLFQENYTVQLLNREQWVAGVSCTRLLVQKRAQADSDQAGASDSQAGAGDSNHYLVDMDAESGLVLGWQELDSHGVLISQMVFESFGYGPAANPIPLGTGSLLESEVGIDALASDSRPFEVLRPRLLPQGYRLSRVFEVVDGQQAKWIRQVFTDGQGALIFMHKQQVHRDGGMVGASTLGVYEEGQWTVLMGDVNGYSLLAVGKLGSNGLQDFVSSCFQ